MVQRACNSKDFNLFNTIFINYIYSIILEVMKTPEEYYNSKSKQESGNIAGVCFILIAVLIIILKATNLIC